MKKILSEEIELILKNKRKLENVLEVDIIVDGKDILIEGKPENEYTAEKVIEAIDMGFPVPVALLIKKEDFLFEIFSIKNYTSRKDFATIRARIIGSGGKTLRTLAELTECYFEIKDNTIGIIGEPESIKNASDAVISIIRGAKQANVYSYLEKHHVQPILDLGLKEKKKSKR
ncbi:Uncharacterised protein [uncultured archaeon]|nr:Uncharacterised protein [uncultured archaeon]